MVRLSFEFKTWEVLAGHGMADRDIAKLLCRAVAGVAKDPKANLKRL